MRAGERRHSHRLVVQDDALLCHNFLPAVRRVLAEWPDAMVAFYVGSAHPGGWYYDTAAHRCERYANLPLHHFVPSVALAMPTRMAISFAEWSDQLGDYAYDDEALRQYREANPHIPAVATIPSLAQHSNQSRSIIGHQHHGHRQARCYVGTYDPLLLDWSAL